MFELVCTHLLHEFTIYDNLIEYNYGHEHSTKGKARFDKCYK